MIPETTTSDIPELGNSSYTDDFGEVSLLRLHSSHPPDLLPQNKCRNVHYVPLNQSCQFVKDNPDCSVESFIEYINFLYCIFEPTDQWIAITISVSADASFSLSLLLIVA